jgi:hypothetical protein
MDQSGSGSDESDKLVQRRRFKYVFLNKIRITDKYLLNENDKPGIYV